MALSGLLSGCNDFLNPAEPYIHNTSKPLLVPIVDTLAPGIEEPNSAYANARDIEPGDLVPDVTDYTIGVNDVLSISIFDLLGEGTGETAKAARVTETGMISLPFIDPVKAEGLTEHQLEKAISKAYQDAKQIQNARVSVTVAEARARTFSIQANVLNPGEYQITRPDFRMLDAMVTSHAPAIAIGAEYAYVIRKPKPAAATQPAEAGPSSTSQPSSDLLAPPPAPTTGPQSRSNSSPSEKRTMLMDGMAGSAPGAAGAAAGNPSRVFKFDDVEAPSDETIIRVPINRLRQYGELKYNIVIRPGDMIIVPDPEQGVYYMGGHMLRSGVYGLSGTKVTLKEAWTGAGGADDFAIPSHSEIIRRVGDNNEVFVCVNMSKIWSGEQPDVYLKPNDEVYVGTNIIAPFLAAARNSFRVTYGFGFLYDRNFYNGPNGF
jgi:polysaccharide export outer membrane protein